LADDRGRLIPPGPHAFWTDRHGGVSAAPYDTANLATHVGDAPDAVRANRERLARAHELAPPDEWVWLDQVHGADVATVTGPGARPTADAAVTAVPGIPLVVLTADCAPIAIVADDAIGVVHAGWRGLVAGVVPAAVDALRGVGTGTVRAVIGPCIRPSHYEFGADDLAAVASRLGDGVVGETVDGRPALDLAAGVRVAFAECGVDDVADDGACTYAETRFFSHRRDGVTGRQAVVAVVL
jgi:purine-nucleoside/S-methyl-5'-thioadenosine phosphorylase / adenosine deaminase